MTDEMILCGERIRLRATEPSDSRAVWSVESDTAQWRANGMCAPLSMYNIEEYARTYDADPYRSGQLRLICELKDNRRGWEETVVGIADLYEISALDRTACVGIYIRPAFRGQGYGRECTETICRYAADLLNIRTVLARIAAGNQRSVRMFEACGFRKAGCLEGWLESRGATEDVLLYQKNHTG